MSRDTQFQGFAKELIRELDVVSTTTYTSFDKAIEAYELVIARRAYDLAFHSIDHTLDYLQERGMKTPGDMGKGILSSIPDMPELPDDDKRYAEMQEEEQE